MDQRLPAVLRSAILPDSSGSGSVGLIREDCPSVDIFDLDHLDSRIGELSEAFPEDFVLNAFAMKVNPLRGVLRAVLGRDMGVECASVPEVHHALILGFPPEKVVYGGLTKTKVRILDSLR